MQSALNFGISLITYFLLFFVAHLLLKLPQYSFLRFRTGRHETIDGIRGLLAIAVFIHHFVVTWGWKTTGVWTRPIESFFHNYGKVGVAIFFMVTGFLFTEKIITNNIISWKKIYKSRIYRIAPLYYFSVLLIIGIAFYQSNFILNIRFIELVKESITWLSFHGESINNFSETRRINAGVDWTLRYEWLFYFTLPLIHLILKRNLQIGSIMLLVIFFFLFLYPKTYYSIQTRFLIFFAIGGLAAYFSNQYKDVKKNITSNVHSSISFTLLIASLFYPGTFTTTHLIIIASFFIYIALGNDLFGLLSLKESILLGEISYSLYLLHGIILYIIFTAANVFNVAAMTFEEYLLLMPLAGIIIVVISAITYKVIEQPFIYLSKGNIANKNLTSSQAIEKITY